MILNGGFKIEQRKAGVVSASLGNHAQGLSYHGMKLNIPVTGNYGKINKRCFLSLRLKLLSGHAERSANHEDSEMQKFWSERSRAR